MQMIKSELLLGHAKLPFGPYWMCWIRQGVEEMMSSGTLAGFPVVDVTATLYDGSFHDVDSSVLAFQIAARAAFREGMRKGAVRLLEPIMKVRHSSHQTCCLAAGWCITSKSVPHNA